MVSFVLLSNSKLVLANQIGSRFFAYMDGRIALAVDIADRSGQYAAAVELKDGFQSHLYTGGGRARPPKVSALETDRVEIEVLKCDTASVEQAQVGDIVVTDEGSLLVAKAWDRDAGQGSLVVNLETGAIENVFGAPCMLVERWILRGYCGDRTMFEITRTGAGT